MRSLLSLMTLILIVSCFEDTYSPDDLFKMIKAGDPSMKAVMPKSPTEPLVRCDEYKPACKNAFVIRIKEMDVIFLSYSSQEDAAKAAAYIKGFVVRNWAIDDVSGEPVLEDFMMKYLGARKVY